jgi:protein-L-isoaspartate(D-aspartate) O-methyltransferase
VTREELLRSLRRRISDERVLDAIAAVPRELFVSPAMASAAYEDAPLRIGAGQTISQPTVVARMCELLELSPTDRVLDVGTGSGYHAAVLSRLCDFVWGIELDPQLAMRAARTLTAVGIDNVAVCAGDGAQGLPEHAPFDAINVAATARDHVPLELQEQLAERGRLVVPVARGRDERLVRVRRDPDGFVHEVLEPVRFVPLR